MASTTTCCDTSTTSACTTESVLRPRFFPRQIITPDDLTLMQDYFRARMRWHNLMMHGWGVACGALVCPAPALDGSGLLPWTVIVRKGYAIGPCGDEIILDCDRTVDLRTSGVTGVAGDACVEPIDPWCSDVYNPNQPRTLFIAVRFKEVMTRPVRVQPHGCGCDDLRCEYSRWRDGYDIGVLTKCPCPPLDTPPQFPTWPSGPIPTCPCSPPTAWVGLAQVDVDADGNVVRIDNCTCRRLIVSFGNFWWGCEDEPAITIDPTTDENHLAQGTSATFTFKGENIQAAATPDLGRDIRISDPKADGKTITFTAAADANAKPGARTLVVRNPDCTWGALDGALTVDPAAAANARKAASRK